MSKTVPFRFKGAEIEALDAYANKHGMTRTAAMKKAVFAMVKAQDLEGSGGEEDTANRTEVISVYLTGAEKDQIKAKAQVYGMCVSVYVRRRTMGHRLPPIIPGSSRLINELQRQGINLNQLTKQVNAAAFTPSRRFPEGQEILASIDKTKELLVALMNPILKSLRVPGRRRPGRPRAREVKKTNLVTD